ncbi:MAG: SDR family NAD(P)-dependent oxidoreductase [Ilumatobacteraceae bacterium]
MSTITAGLFADLGADVAGEAFGRLDVLVNCAGGSRTKPFEETVTADLDAIIALDLRGPWVLSMAARELLTADGGGSIDPVR